MQEKQAKENESPTPDRARIKRLVDAAAQKTGGSKQLANALFVQPQLVSNWKNGVKTPSPEAQAELAQIAGQNVAITGLMAMIEKTEGARKARLQEGYRKLMEDAARDLELRKPFSDEDRVELLRRVVDGLDENDKTQAEAGKMLKAILDALANTSWRKRWHSYYS